MILYGRNAVQEALRGCRRVPRVWAADRRLGRELLSAGAGAEPELALTSDEELRQLCGSPDHQGLACEVEPYRYADPGSLVESEQALVVALDQVQDPQNLGALCRTAECAGAVAVVVPERRAAEVTPAVCRASAGAVEHLAIARVRNLADFLAHAKEAGAWIYGAEASARVPYTEPDYTGRTVLVLGSEGSGLRPRVRASCDQLVSLPLAGRVTSLNVSAAAAVLIYEVVRQRRSAPPVA